MTDDDSPRDADDLRDDCRPSDSDSDWSDPDLARVATAWPRLPPAIKRAILALLEVDQ